MYNVMILDPLNYPFKKDIVNILLYDNNYYTLSFIIDYNGLPTVKLTNHYYQNVIDDISIFGYNIFQL